MAGKSVLLTESPAGITGQGQEFWFLFYVSMGFYGFFTAQWLASKRECPKATRQKTPGLSWPRLGRYPASLPPHSIDLPVTKLNPSSRGEDTDPTSIRGVSKDLWPTDLPQKAVSSNMCFRVIWNKLLHYPKLTFSFSVVRERAEFSKGTRQCLRPSLLRCARWLLPLHSESFYYSIHVIWINQLTWKNQSNPLQLLPDRAEHGVTPWEASLLGLANQRASVPVTQFAMNPCETLGICVVIWIICFQGMPYFKK